VSLSRQAADGRAKNSKTVAFQKRVGKESRRKMMTKTFSGRAKHKNFLYKSGLSVRNRIHEIQHSRCKYQKIVSPPESVAYVVHETHAFTSLFKSEGIPKLAHSLTIPSQINVYISALAWNGIHIQVTRKVACHNSAHW